jgi:hypothetical protein|tara:strand:- start:2904 stop:3455 length:552 start_codon:yes stop_codon:yes gene_type:complete
MYIMPKTKEEQAEYKRAYDLEHKEEIAEYRKVWYDENHERQMINKWRYQGHFIPEGTEHAAYVKFDETTHCEFCGWELVTGGTKKSNTKCRHHDHDIEGEDNFIGIICDVCNKRETVRNTSGQPNIYYIKLSENWMFQIRYCRKRYSKGGFKTFEDALTYKAAWMATNSPAVFHDPSWEMKPP